LTIIKSSPSPEWQRDRVHARVAAIALAVGCSGAATTPDAASPADADIAEDCLSSSGRHRLFVQGHGGTPREDGRYPLVHSHALCDDSVFVEDMNGNGTWEPGEEPRSLGPPELVHGEHFLVGIGAYTEFAMNLCADVTGDIALYIPNYDEAGSRALHQVLAGDVEIGRAIDEEAGQSGYNPFVRVVAGTDPDAGPGGLLILRSTNLSGVPFSVMVWQPPSEYESWILVEVP